MRRSFPLVSIALVALIGLAAPAGAQEAGEADSIGTIDNEQAAGALVPMACKVVQGEQAQRVGVACAWREAPEPATGYRLGRLELGGRKVVFRTADLSKHAFVDARVRPGLQYAYKLQVIGANGRVIGQSRFQLVLVRPGAGDDERPGMTATPAARPSAERSTTTIQRRPTTTVVRTRPTPPTTVPGSTASPTSTTTPERTSSTTAPATTSTTAA